MGVQMLSQNERERYSRQILLFGEEGQERLKNATIFIAGAGGLGSPVSIYLACGVGRIILVDKDAVERTNLNRESSITTGISAGRDGIRGGETAGDQP